MSNNKEMLAYIYKYGLLTALEERRLIVKIYNTV